MEWIFVVFFEIVIELPSFLLFCQDYKQDKEINILSLVQDAQIQLNSIPIKCKCDACVQEHTCVHGILLKIINVSSIRLLVRTRSAHVQYVAVSHAMHGRKMTMANFYINNTAKPIINEMPFIEKLRLFFIIPSISFKRQVISS